MNLTPEEVEYQHHIIAIATALCDSKTLEDNDGFTWQTALKLAKELYSDGLRKEAVSGSDT